ncbi:mannose-6-phosphate isomerase, partial [Candidatus Pacearchaeota archaeon]
NGFDAFVDAASKVDDISRRSCRKHVENCFTIERQTKDYLNVYKDMIYKT